MIAELNFTLVFGMAINIHVNTADATIHGAQCSTSGVKIVEELRMMDIPELNTIKTGTNSNTII
jgi:hypothetical protein